MGVFLGINCISRKPAGGICVYPVVLSHFDECVNTFAQPDFVIAGHMLFLPSDCIGVVDLDA